jgi:hypothetical protein
MFDGAAFMNIHDITLLALLDDTRCHARGNVLNPALACGPGLGCVVIINAKPLAMYNNGEFVKIIMINKCILMWDRRHRQWAARHGFLFVERSENIIQLHISVAV